MSNEKSKYNHSDYMPKDSVSADMKDSLSSEFSNESIDVEEPCSSQETLNVDVVECVKSDREVQYTTNPEMGVVLPRDSFGPWAKIVSVVFNPFILSTYFMLIAMWCTPLSNINLNIRLGATAMILVLTDWGPSLFKVAMMRFGRKNNPEKKRMGGFTIVDFVFMFFLGLAAYYLYSLHAPGWLVQFFIAGAVTLIVSRLLDFFVTLSRHTVFMGTFTAAVFYLFRYHICILYPTISMAIMILLAGLMVSSRLFLTDKNIVQCSLGYVIGFVITYITMSLPLINNIYYNF
ncbi:MAG: hypothetical protein J1F20_00970 [Muribaculaceae bacterium]|nr:hypothetical protein [Muribaculaceae bacterium]